MPALVAGVPVAGTMLQVTPLGSFVVAAIEKVSAVAVAARETGRVTDTAPPEDEELDDDVDDDELDAEEEEEDTDAPGGESPFEPPLPQAERIVAQASAPAISTKERARSRISVASSR